MHERREHTLRDAVLPQSVLRNLGQKEYEKRKQAALDVESMVREWRESRDVEKA